MAMEDACVLAEELRVAATVESTLCLAMSNRRKARFELDSAPKHGSIENHHCALGSPPSRYANGVKTPT